MFALFTMPDSTRTIDNPLWKPTTAAIAASHMTAFARAVQSRYNLNVETYAQLHEWSIAHLEDFWNTVWDYCHVIGVKRQAGPISECADRVVSIADLAEVLPKADVVVLTCPLTPETEGLINAERLALMKPSAHLINVARGRVVDEPALIAALQAGQIAGAGLDVTVDEPLPATSPLWGMFNVIITPHSAGETGRYEANVIDLLEENMSRLWRGDVDLKNGIV